MTDPTPIDPDSLESTDTDTKLKRIAIDPITRVEGHGKVSLLLDEHNRVKQARLHIVEFRGFEKFIQGRPYWELPIVVQRLCGICPVSHHLAAAKAIDQLVGVEQLSPTAEKIRRLLHYGQILQSHALHFFHLASPDLLLGIDDPIKHRNITGLLDRHPELARQGIMLRKFGQQIIETISGKRIHGTCAIPGGVNKALNHSQVSELSQQLPEIIQWAQQAVEIAAHCFLEDEIRNRHFARIETSMMSLCQSDGTLEFYHAPLRVKDKQGVILLDNIDYRQYQTHIREQVKPWSYMKFPRLNSVAESSQFYRVGPLARINNCDFIDTPMAESARIKMMKQAQGQVLQSTLAYHWARMIELLHCAESIQQMFMDADLCGNQLKVKGDPCNEGIGAIEAPRGTLIHHYEVDDNGLVTKANLIVSTTHNNHAMNQSVRQVAADLLTGQEITEPLMNQIEVAIRAYDPCLSCATHALGKMPLVVELIDNRGELLHKRSNRAAERIDG